jgi:hypothetical protein
MAQVHHLVSNAEAVPISISMFLRVHLVNLRRNSDARSKYEVEPLLRYEKAICHYRELQI